MTSPQPYIHFDLSGGPQFPDPDRPPEAYCGQAGAHYARDWRDVTCPRCLELLGWEDEEPDIDDEPPPDYGPPGSGAIITEYP